MTTDRDGDFIADEKDPDDNNDGVADPDAMEQGIDAFEEDDSLETAPLLPVGAALAIERTLDGGDLDLARFRVVAGEQYEIVASPLDRGETGPDLVLQILGLTAR